jgi:hypothetical protein
VIQIFNVGAERMLGYAARRGAEQDHAGRHLRPAGADRARQGLSAELGTPITPGFEALVFKASRGIEDIYELTYIRKDGSRCRPWCRSRRCATRRTPSSATC